jgi:hypothetical protein
MLWPARKRATEKVQARNTTKRWHHWHRLLSLSSTARIKLWQWWHPTSLATIFYSAMANSNVNSALTIWKYCAITATIIIGASGEWVSILMVSLN